MNFPNTPEGVAGLYAKFIGDCQHGRNIPGQFTSVLAQRGVVVSLRAQGNDILAFQEALEQSYMANGGPAGSLARRSMPQSRRAVLTSKSPIAATGHKQKVKLCKKS